MIRPCGDCVESGGTGRLFYHYNLLFLYGIGDGPCRMRTQSAYNVPAAGIVIRMSESGPARRGVSQVAHLMRTDV